MKHAIYPEKQGTPTADSEDASYPATNLINNVRSKCYKASASDQTTIITEPLSIIASTYGAIAIFNTNATSGEITITDDVTSDKALDAVAWTIDQGRYWQEFTAPTNAATITLSLTTTETTLECGILKAGDLLTIKNPAYGISEGIKDYSIKKEYRNGAFYTKKLNMVRTFGYSCLMARESEYRNLMTLYEYYGPDPFAMLLTDNVSGGDDIWSVFGLFDGTPKASHSTPDYSNVSVSIQEAV